MLHNPELCFLVLNTSEITSDDLRGHASTSTTITNYLLRLAISHGFLHALNADSVLEVVEYYIKEVNLSLHQAANFFMLLLLLTPSNVNYWSDDDISCTIAALNAVEKLQDTQFASHLTVIPWALHVSHQGNYLGVAYNSAHQYGPALHRDSVINVLIAATSLSTGVNDPSTHIGTMKLIACAHITHWHSRILVENTVTYLTQMWAAFQWLHDMEPDSAIRDKTFLALAHTTWEEELEPAQVASYVTATLNAIKLHWDLPRVLRLLAAVKTLGESCTTDDIIYLLQTME